MQRLMISDERGSGRHQAEHDAGFEAGISGQSITSGSLGRLHYLAGWQAGRASWLRSQSGWFGWSESSLTRDRA